MAVPRSGTIMRRKATKQIISKRKYKLKECTDKIISLTQSEIEKYVVKRPTSKYNLRQRQVAKKLSDNLHK